MTTSSNSLAIRMEELSPRVIIANCKDTWDVNVAAIILDNFIIVIDALMYPRQSKEFREKLEKKYRLPVKHLFITHYHADHVFGMVVFKDTEILGSNTLIEAIKQRKTESWTDRAFEDWKKKEPELAELIDEIEIIIPTKGFDDKHVLTDEELRVEFYESGGHTSCSSYAYFPEEKVLFTGDELAAEFWPFISEPSGDPEKWIKAFEDMLTLNIKTVVPGHGPIVGKEHIKEHLIFFKKLKGAVLKAISEKKALKDVEVPEFYEPAEDWQIPRALDHLYTYYSRNRDF